MSYSAGPPGDRPKEERLRPGRPRCPYCGAEVGAHARRCWLCQEKMPAAYDGGEQDARIHQLSERIALPAPSEGPGPMAAFGILALILGIGMALAAPGILIIMVILLAPAFIRTLAKSPGPTTREAAPSSFWTFLSSVGVVAVVGLASFAAFFATCFVVCLGGLGLNEMRGGKNYEWIMIASVGAGLVPGIAVAFLLFRRFWGRKG
jgi:hypothetical protein